MKRRDFLRFSALTLLPIVSCQKKAEDQIINYDITLLSDMEVAHLVFQSIQFPKTRSVEKEILIVGGGVAGLSAAYNLGNRDFVLCELSDRLGGSSSSESYGGEIFAQGAHYELDYPDYFGKESLQMLEKLGIIQFENATNLWRFTDKQYLVDFDYESQTLVGTEYYEDMLPGGEMWQRFDKMIQPYAEKLVLPTRLINSQFYHLNEVYFSDFLQQNIALTPHFAQAIDYHMLDDFGGTSRQVSALAGLYYYANRPYKSEEIRLFSPPEGNDYFVKKLAHQIPKEQVLLQHLVRRVHETKSGFEVEVVDIAKREIVTFKVKKIIYAGHKHALKHIYPQQFPLFEHNQYAPWMVVNFILKKNTLEEGYWQNELLSSENGFLGFVDSDSQHTAKKKRVLTAYYCLPEWDREKLAKIGETQNEIVQQTIRNIAFYFGLRQEIFASNVEKVFIKVMGHAMPIPVPHYLFSDKNYKRTNPNIAFAGVDNSRLPLFLEALDSGIVASELVSS